MPRNKALAIIPDDQLSLAIGKEGQNVRLAAKLTGWKIDIKSASQVEQELREGKIPEEIKEIKDETINAEAIEAEKPKKAKKKTASKKAQDKTESEVEEVGTETTKE